MRRPEPHSNSHRRRPVSPPRLRAGLVALLLLTASAALWGQAAEPPAPATDSFLPIGPYLFQYAGKVSSEAKIYHSPGKVAILIRAPELPAPVLLVPGLKTIGIFQAADLHENQDGSIDLAPNARPLPAGKFTLEENLPIFTLEGKDARFLLKPPLLGAQTGKEILASMPEYGRNAEAYSPQSFHMDRLKSLDQKIRVQVYFASWCDVCRELLPKILRIEEELASHGFAFDYYGLPYPISKDPIATELDVANLPTGIIFVGDKEVARVTGWGWKFPEMGLNNNIR